MSESLTKITLLYWSKRWFNKIISVFNDLYMRFNAYNYYEYLVKGQVNRNKNAPSKNFYPKLFFQRTMTWSNLPPLLRIELLWAQQELACAKKLSKCLNRIKKCSIANIVDFSLVSSYIILNTMRIVNNISEQRMSRTAVVETRDHWFIRVHIIFDFQLMLSKFYMYIVWT